MSTNQEQLVLLKLTEKAGELGVSLDGWPTTEDGTIWSKSWYILKGWRRL